MKELYMRNITMQFCLGLQLSTNLKDYITEENFFRIKKILLDEICYQILPFHIWNHLFMCEVPILCGYVQKFYERVQKLHKTMFQIKEYQIISPKNYMWKQMPGILEGIATAKKIHLFAHTNSVSSKESLFGLNLCGFYYESLSSLFFAPENLFGYIILYCI